MEDIAELCAGLRFAKRIVGGVEERDVWKKLDEVQAAYRKVYEAQHERDLALIKERDKTIRELSASLEQIKKLCGESAAGVEIPKAPTPYQNGENGMDNSDPDLDRRNEPGVEGAVRKQDQNRRSGVKGAFREPSRDGRPNVKGVYRERDRDDETMVEGSSRDPDRNKISDMKNVGRDQYRDSRPEVEGASCEPSRTKVSKAATKTSPAMRGSIDSLSSDSSAEADLAFDWLDDGDFNL